jgi:hypothetical protein
MTRIFIVLLVMVISYGCSSSSKLKETALPLCVNSTIKAMSKDRSQGIRSSVTQYTYKSEKVYYIVSACCDKYNVVYDSNCRLLGYPDGGFTGKGDGSLPGFFNEATDRKIIWEKKE